MLSKITKILRIVCTLCLSVLLLVVIIVIIDTKLKLGAVWASGLSTFLLGWIVMFGGALAYAEKSHLGLDILSERFDPRTRLVSTRVGHVIVLLFSLGVMLYGGGALVQGRADMGQTIPALNISKAWFYLSLPLAGGMISLTAVAHLLVTKSNSTEEGES